VDKYTARIRKDLVRNKAMAAEISEVLAKYKFEIPDDKIVVWGPMVFDLPDTVWEAIDILRNGIPAPELLEAAFKGLDKFNVRRF
jgi:hypothetical protein